MVKRSAVTKLALLAMVEHTCQLTGLSGVCWQCSREHEAKAGEHKVLPHFLDIPLYLESLSQLKESK